MPYHSRKPIRPFGSLTNVSVFFASDTPNPDMPNFIVARRGKQTRGVVECGLDTWAVKSTAIARSRSSALPPHPTALLTASQRA